MSIKSIKLKNFKSINELNIEANNQSQVICFVGENGSSKTSLLSLIVDSIISNLNISFPDYDPEAGKRFRSISHMEISDDKDYYFLNLKYSSGDEINNYERNVFKITKNQNNINIYNSVEWGKIPLNQFHQEENTPYQDKNSNYLINNIFLYRPSYRYEPDALEVNDLNDSYVFKISTQKKKQTDYPFPFKVAHSGTDLESLIIELLLDNFIGFENSMNAFSGIPRILNTVTNKDYGNFQISRHPYRKLWSSTQGLITSLSQGELDLLVTITSIVTRQLYIYDNNEELRKKYKSFQDVPGLVIIDEVDLHLHPKAQENYLKVLTTSFKNIQFLVTTHSPFVVRGLPTDSIVVQLPSGTVIEEDFSLMDIDSITNTIFNYEGRFSNNIENDLKKFKELISNPNKEQNLNSLIEIYSKYRTSSSIIDELDTFLSIFSTPDLTKKVIGE